MAIYVLATADDKRIQIVLDYNPNNLKIRSIKVEGASGKRLTFSIDRDIGGVVSEFASGQDIDLTSNSTVTNLGSFNIFMVNVTDPLLLDGELGIFPPFDFVHLRFEFL